MKKTIHLLSKRIFLVRCPKCKNDMKYHTYEKDLAEKSKRCVYCGRSFRIKDRILKQKSQ